jgi:hypothetical protein
VRRCALRPRALQPRRFGLAWTAYFLR